MFILIDYIILGSYHIIDMILKYDFRLIYEFSFAVEGQIKARKGW